MAKKVYIGVGHGGTDSGAVANGYKEKDFNLDVAKSCRDELNRHGVSVKISRESDVSENLSARIKECNEYNPDVAADIHHNAGGGDGVEIFHAKNDSKDDALAKNILNEIVAIGQNSRGIKTKLTSSGADYFGFVRQIKCPSVLIECAFIDNKTDVKIVDTLAERKKMGVAIAKGILKTLGITYKKPTTTTTTTNNGELYRVRKSWADAKSQIGAYSSLANAKQMADKNKGYYVFDSKGKQVYPVSTTTSTKPAAKTTPKKGDEIKVTTKDVLYASSSAKTGKNFKKAGTYYIYDGIAINGRYRITNSKNRVGKKPIVLYVTGYMKF